jgi:hypothetical protein
MLVGGLVRFEAIYTFRDEGRPCEMCNRLAEARARRESDTARLEEQFGLAPPTDRFHWDRDSIDVAE